MAATRCVIAGGGPAGMMAGYLLARAGIAVTVLEKHKDFLRDFRGDTIHPSTLQVIDELGLLEEFLALPHQKVEYAEGDFGGTRLRIGDFTHLPVKCPFIAFMPQWDFLNFMAAKARAFPSFRLMTEAEATALMFDGDEVAGVRVKTPSGEQEITADLVIAADGRDSRLRAAAGFEVEDLGAPIDVLWFRLPVRADDHPAVLGRIDAGQILVSLYRGDYWQCALIIRKGGFDAVKAAGLAAFRARVAALARRSNADEIETWDDVKLLTVTVNRIREWHRPGLLVIGDAAHAMSPIGGVGINLAIQDAVATANILAAPLLKGRPSPDVLARVRKRRWFPAVVTQGLQVAIQNRMIDPILDSDRVPKVPALLKLAQKWPVLQRVLARIIGLGIRPEHVRGV